MDEREFWVQVRRGLLVVLDAIEQRWHLPRSADFKLQVAKRAPAELPHAAPALHNNQTGA